MQPLYFLSLFRRLSFLVRSRGEKVSGSVTVIPMSGFTTGAAEIGTGAIDDAWKWNISEAE